MEYEVTPLALKFVFCKFIGVFKIDWSYLQMTSPIKDYRYRTTTYLLHQLSRDESRLDATLGIKILDVVCKLFHDASSDVSGVAVKW